MNFCEKIMKSKLVEQQIETISLENNKVTFILKN